MYKVLIADNEQIFVNGLKAVINNLGDYEIVSVVPNVDDLDSVCEKINPDLVIMRTFFFLKNTGFVAAQELKEKHPNIKIIMMLDMGKFAQIEAAQKAGVDSCILRSASPVEFIFVLEKTMTTGASPLNIPNDNLWGPYKVALTKREHEIVLCLCQNMSYEKIAEEMCVSRRTVVFHVGNILSKTSHKNTTGLLMEAAHKGYEINWHTEDDVTEL